MRNEKPTKRELKHSKIIQKEVEELNREAEAMNKKYEDRNPDPDSDNQYIDKKGKKWWQRFDQRNFPPLTNQECLRLKDITTSELILQQSPKEALPPTTYAKFKILTEYDLLLENDLLHVLFKTHHPKYRCLASYALQSAISSPPEQSPQPEQPSNFRILPSDPSKTANLDLQQIKLALAGYNQDQQACRTISHYKRSLSKLSEKTPIEKELYFWEKELHSTHKENRLGWDKLVTSIKQHNQQPNFSTQQEILRIRDYLMWATVLKYFEHGYADKTNQQLQQLMESQRMIKPAKSKDAASSKKFFETDCKICFCSFNYDSNQVLYCDSCNTSFHLACYGLQEIPNEQIYYCDCCKFQKQENIKKINCQLCNKTKFPIKNIQGRFYHVTCLMLFNLVCIDQGTLVFKNNINHQKILQMVVESELAQQECEFCCNTPGAETGIRMRCCFAGCNNSAHPICAYINGCKFWIKRDSKNEKLITSYYCNKHDESRDWIQQTYLRRYMCNFRKTSELKQTLFRQQYDEQVQKMKQGQESLKKGWDSNKIVAKTRFLKKKMAQEQQKQNAGTEVQTYSRLMLQKLKKKKDNN